MAEMNIRFKDKAGNYLYPKTKIGNVMLSDGTALDLSKYATMAQLNEALAGLPHIKKQVVDELPLISEADENTLYLVPADKVGDNNILLEYLLIDGTWEMVGSTQTDLTGYVTETALGSALSGKADKNTTYTKSEVDSALGGKADAGNTYTKNEVDTSLGGKADKNTTYTKGEVDKLISDLSGEMGDIQYDVLD